jgi:hypothetical protein
MLDGMAELGESRIGRFSEAKRAMLDAFERDYFTALEEATNGNVSEMARVAGMERAHVRSYLERHGIGRPALSHATLSAELEAVAVIVQPRDGETLADAARRLAGITCRCSRPGGTELTRKARGLACQPPGHVRRYACKCACHAANSSLVNVK